METRKPIEELAAEVVEKPVHARETAGQARKDFVCFCDHAEH